MNIWKMKFKNYQIIITPENEAVKDKFNKLHTSFTCRKVNIHKTTQMA